MIYNIDAAGDGDIFNVNKRQRKIHVGLSVLCICKRRYVASSRLERQSRRDKMASASM